MIKEIIQVSYDYELQYEKPSARAMLIDRLKPEGDQTIASGLYGIAKRKALGNQTIRTKTTNKS